MSTKKAFFKDSVIYGVGSAVKKLIGIFLLPFYTRALSVEDFGVLESLSTFIFFVTVLIGLGLDSGTGYYFFKAKNEIEKGRILYTTFVIRLISIIPITILSFFSNEISQLLFHTGNYNWVVFISIHLIFVNLLMGEQTRIYRYVRNPWKYNTLIILKSICGIGLGLLLVVFLKLGLIGAQLASIISSLLVVLVSFFTFTRKVYCFKFSFYWAKELLRFGFPLIWASVATWVFSVSDRFFLLHYSDLKEIGYYSIGNTFSQPISLINMAVQMSFGVLFFELYNKDESKTKDETKKMAIDSYNLYLFIAVSISVFMSVFGIEFINIITTPEYLLGAFAIPFLTFSAVFSQSYQLMNQGITLAEKNIHYTWITILTALLNIGLNFLLIPKYGFVGASISTIISMVIYLIVKEMVARRYFKVAYPYLRIGLIMLISLCSSLCIPILKFNYGYDLSVFWKIILLLGNILIFHFMKLVNFHKTLNELKSIFLTKK